MKKTERHYWEPTVRQFVYESDKGKISLITPSWISFQKFEIYAYENKELFEDVMRFDTLEDAEKFIQQKLGGEIE